MWFKLKFQPFVPFSRVPLALGERAAVTWIGAGTSVARVAGCFFVVVFFFFKVSPVVSVVSQSFSLTVKFKPKAVLAEMRNFLSDISVLRASFEAVLLAYKVSFRGQETVSALVSNVPLFWMEKH